MPEMVFIFLVALVVIGPKKLPEVGRQLGKFLAEFKRASNEFKHQIESEIISIEIQERSKHDAADGPKVLPPEEPWERLMRPLSESVSRVRTEIGSLTEGNPEPVTQPERAIPERLSSVKPAGSE